MKEYIITSFFHSKNNFYTPKRAKWHLIIHSLSWFYSYTPNLSHRPHFPTFYPPQSLAFLLPFLDWTSSHYGPQNTKIHSFSTRSNISFGGHPIKQNGRLFQSSWYSSYADILKQLCSNKNRDLGKKIASCTSITILPGVKKR